MTKPAISVVMMTTTARRKLRQAMLPCLLGQKGVSFELVLVLDADIGITMPEAKQIAGSGIRYRVVNKAWETLTEKQNAGVDATQTEWVTLWDDDDWSSFVRLQQTVEAIDRTVDIIGKEEILYHELCSEHRRTVKFTTNAHVIDGCAAFRKSLWKKKPFELKPRPFGGPDPGNVGDWIVRRVQSGARVAHVEYDYVVMMHTGNTTMPSTFRVDEASLRVLDGPKEYTVVGGREYAVKLMGAPTMLAFEKAMEPDPPPPVDGR